ncbi:MAG: uncharacterized protein JWO95_1808 [Verrucomicrobiales bacterium]|nr:uncharacterized protein [Verrucomicrobiales bacterium]
MKKIVIRIVLALVILLIVVVGACWMFLGAIVTKGVNTVGPVVTKTDVKLGSATVSILSGSATLHNLFVGNPEGYTTPSAITADKISVSLKPMSIFGDKIIVQSVNVIAPDITVEGGITKNNLTKIMDNTQGSADQAESKKNEPKSEKKTPEEKAARKIEVDDFLITGAKVHYNGTLTGGKTITLPIPDIHLQNLGTGPDGITAADLTKQVMNAVTAQVIPALAKSVGDLGKGATGLLKDAGGKGVSGVTNVTKGLKSLFGK